MAATGGALAYFAATSNALKQEPIARASIQLNCSPEQAYRYWRDFENLPRFMRHLENVSVLPNGSTRWTALGPMGTPVSWDTEIVNERENQSITWRSLPHSDVMVDGSVDFRPATGNRGTVMTAIMRYNPTAGPLGAAVARLLGKDPNFMMQQDLRRMKALIETGEIPTVEGQSHGPRSITAAVSRVLDPDRPIRKSADLGELVGSERRIS